MSEFESVEVPFVVVGNRRVLTDWQLVDDPYLHKFVERFSNSFERSELRRCYFLLERNAA